MACHSPSLCFSIWLCLFMSGAWAGKTLSFFFYSSESTHMLLFEIFFFLFWVFLNSQICHSKPGFGKAVSVCELPISCYTNVASYSKCHRKTFNKWRLQQQGRRHWTMTIITSLYTMSGSYSLLRNQTEISQERTLGDQLCRWLIFFFCFLRYQWISGKASQAWGVLWLYVT